MDRRSKPAVFSYSFTASFVNILVIAETLRSDAGAGRYASKILAEYPALGVEPAIMTVHGGSGIPGERARLAPLTSLSAFLKNVYLLRTAARACDILHAFDIWPYGVYAALAVFGTRKKLFLNGVGTYSVAPRTRSLKGYLMRATCRRAQKVYCISDYTAKRIRERASHAKTEVVLLGTTVFPQPSTEFRNAIRAKYHLKGRFPVFLTVGALKHRKGQLDTLRALSLLMGDYPNLVYLMAGSADDRVYVEAVMNYARENGMTEAVRIISGFDDDELAALYTLSDIFCLNSRNDGEHFEGFGLVFLEAAQFGVPGIGSRDSGIESALKDGYSGYLTRQGDARDIAEKARMLLEEETRKRMGEQARKFAARFSWKEAAKRFVSDYA